MWLFERSERPMHGDKVRGAAALIPTDPLEYQGRSRQSGGRSNTASGRSASGRNVATVAACLLTAMMTLLTQTPSYFYD